MVDKFTARRIEQVVKEVRRIWDRAPNITDDDAGKLPFHQLSLRRLRGELFKGET